MKKGNSIAAKKAAATRKVKSGGDIVLNKKQALTLLKVGRHRDLALAEIYGLKKRGPVTKLQQKYTPTGAYGRHLAMTQAREFAANKDMSTPWGSMLSKKAYKDAKKTIKKHKGPFVRPGK